jgi:hypothetical protein
MLSHNCPLISRNSGTDGTRCFVLVSQLNDPPASTSVYASIGKGGGIDDISAVSGYFRFFLIRPNLHPQGNRKRR